MARLDAQGIRVDVPAGWDGRVTVRREGIPEPLVSANGITAMSAVPRPVLHLASFGLPEERGDFGGGAVELMGDHDMFVVLFEYAADATRTPLFASQGLPRTLEPGWFQPTMLRKGIVGQAGFQTFFQESARAFTLYVVLGSSARRRRLVPKVNAVLTTITIAPTASVPQGAR